MMSTPTPTNASATGVHRSTVPARQGLNLAARAAARVVPYAATVMAVLAVGLPTMILPFWSDTAIFSTVGKAIADGGFPYVDAWDQKPPSIYLIFAVAIHGPFRLIGNVRAFDLAWMSVTVVLLIELGRRWWSLRAGVISGLTFGITYFTISTWTQLAQPDGFIGLPIVLALLLHTEARGRWWLLVLAGVALGFAFQLRAIMALLIPFFPLPALADARRGRRLSLWCRDMAWIGAGFAAFQAVLAIYLVIGGALGEFIAATRFATGYTRIGGPWQGPEGPTLSAYLETVRFSLLYWAENRLVLTVPAAIGGISGAFFVRDRRCQQMLLFVALAYLGIAVQAKFFWYHYSYMLPFLALLAGWAWDQAITWLRCTQPRLCAYGVIGVLAGALLLCTPEVLDAGIRQWKDYIRYQAHPAEWEQFYAGFGGYPASQEAAWYLQQHTEPGDQIYVWGYDPLLYLLSGRAHANRFIYAFPLMSDWVPSAWQDEFLADMQADPPVYFVTQHDQGGLWITGHTIDPADYIAWLPPLQEWLQNNYDLEAEIDAYTFYRRRTE